MEKFDPIKMVELVKVEDPDSEGGLTLVFSDKKQVKIKIVDGKLVSEVVSQKSVTGVLFIKLNCQFLCF